MVRTGHLAQQFSPFSTSKIPDFTLSLPYLSFTLICYTATASQGCFSGTRFTENQFWSKHIRTHSIVKGRNPIANVLMFSSFGNCYQNVFVQSSNRPAEACSRWDTPKITLWECLCVRDCVQLWACCELPECKFMCSSKECLVDRALEHTVQVKGFSPVCMRWWTSRVCFWVKPFPQTKHLKGFSPVRVFINHLINIKTLWQVGQGYSFCSFSSGFEMKRWTWLQTVICIFMVFTSMSVCVGTSLFRICYWLFSAGDFLNRPEATLQNANH